MPPTRRRRPSPRPRSRGGGARRHAASAAAAQRWVQAPGSSLTFTFDQAGAASKGSFKQFSTELAYDEKSPRPAAST